MSRDAGPALRGRRSECEALDQLVAGVLAGAEPRRSSFAARRESARPRCWITSRRARRDAASLRAAGVESEMELPFAGLHQLCAPMLDRLEHLPGPQSDALATAFGLSAGDSPDRFLVGLAALTLLSDVADERPLRCVVDDAQWLDRASAQALAFVARRLRAEAVAVVFAEREPSERAGGTPGAGGRAAWPTRTREPCSSRRHGPAGRTGARPDRRRDAREPAGADGAAAWPDARRAGRRFGLSTGSALSGQIEESFRRRLSRFPGQPASCCSIAAAEPVGDP